MPTGVVRDDPPNEHAGTRAAIDAVEDIRDDGPVLECVDAQYADIPTRREACVGWPAGKQGDMDGNTLGCRDYHRTVAARSADNAITHCPHTSPSGGGVCE